MLRATQYMKELRHPTPLAPRRQPPGPVVIWNLVRRCNLCCEHCYSITADIDFPGELSTQQVLRTMDDLKAFGVPVLILSGGEPLLRPDLFDIAARAKSQGFYVGLSTNGTTSLRTTRSSPPTGRSWIWNPTACRWPSTGEPRKGDRC